MLARTTMILIQKRVTSPTTGLPSRPSAFVRRRHQQYNHINYHHYNNHNNRHRHRHDRRLRARRMSPRLRR